MQRVVREATGGRIDRIVELAQRHLDMDVAFLASFTDGRQVYRCLAGDADSFGARLGDGPALTGTYCQRLVDGDLPSVIRNSAHEPRVRDLPTTRDARIGAYIGVPLRMADGSVYGTFCCMSHDPKEDLTDRDARFMAMLAEVVIDELTAELTGEAERSAVRQVIAEKEVGVALQPVVEIATGRCTAVEALARFPASLGSPDSAFAAAERAGLRADLEVLCARAAYALIPAVGPGRALAINCSPDAACQLALAVPDELRLDDVILEITEHAAVESYPLLRERIEPLRERGLRLAVDDAGAGFASLRHVIELKPDIIKIDRGIVSGIEEDEARRAVVMTFVLLALNMGATVVAEGVETLAELTTVAELGVDAVQGYLIARPSQYPRDLTRWLDASTSLLPVARNGARRASLKAQLGRTRPSRAAL